MKYISVCSGIEAASQAWHPLGWQPVAFSEIEDFPSAVLAHRYPIVPNLGDMTKFHDWPDYDINLLVGGTPCQAFSVAGLRQGLSDPRGNLTLTFLAMADRYRPEWLVWENVPGVLSDRTNAFGQLLAGLGQLGYGWAYRVLDAQYFGLAQRRKRVFVVANLGSWSRAASVLFEPDCLRGNPPPSREPGKKAAPTLATRTRGGGGLGSDFDIDRGCIPIQEPGKRTGVASSDRNYGIGLGEAGDPMFTLQAGAVHGVACEHLVASVAPCLKGNHVKNSDAAMEASSLVTERQWPVEVAPTLNANFGEKQGLEDQHALGGWGCSFSEIAKCLTAKSQRNDAETENLIPTHQGGFFDDPNPIAFNANAQAQQLPRESSDTTINHGLTCSQNAAVAFQTSQSGTRTDDVHATLDSNNGSRRHNGALIGLSVRRLTPTECERLQGFPDNYTLIPGKFKKRKTQDWSETVANLVSLGMDRATAIDLANGPDGPRYKALGNSMAVPVMAWIGRRIQMMATPEILDLDLP